MKHIITYLDFINENLLPKEYRSKILLYHATEFENLFQILKTGKLFGTEDYDNGIATSRNKDYLFGRGPNEDDVVIGWAESQLILDYNKIRQKYKVVPYDWEQWKTDKKDQKYHQSEEKIYPPNNEILDIHKYIFGIHLNKNVSENYIKLKTDEYVNSLINKYNWVIFDENWEPIDLNDDQIEYMKKFV